MSKYIVTTGYRTKINLDVISKETLAMLENDAMIYVLNEDGDYIYSGEVKDAPAAIADLPSGMRRSVVDGTTYTVRIGAKSWVAADPTQPDLEKS